MTDKNQNHEHDHEHEHEHDEKRPRVNEERDGVYASQHDAETEADTASGGPAD